MATLTERFREIEITVDSPSRLPANWPVSWMQTEQSDSVVRFVDTQFEQARTMAELGRVFPGPKQIAIRPMPLRAIFVTLAKASRKAA